MTKADIVYQTFKLTFALSLIWLVPYDLYDLSCQTACGQMFSFY